MGDRVMSVYNVNAARLRKAARYVAGQARHQPGLSADHVTNLFFEAGFFAAAGYGCAEDDSRLERLPTPPECTLLIRSFTGSVIGLVLITSPGRALEGAAGLREMAPQMLGRLQAVAALTDGTRLLLFSVQDGYLSEQIHEFNLAALSLDEASELAAYLSQCRVDWKRQLRHPHVSAKPLGKEDLSAAFGGSLQ